MISSKNLEFVATGALHRSSVTPVATCTANLRKALQWLIHLSFISALHGGSAAHYTASSWVRFFVVVNHGSVDHDS